MRKLNKEKRKQVKDIINHEIVVFPCEGEIGFEEYLDEKTKYFISGMNAWGKLESHKLVLRYPDIKSPAEEFDWFYASEEIASGGGEFVGCFAIDVTDYLNKPEHTRFLELLSYIQRRKNVHFLLMVFTEDGKIPDLFVETLSEYSIFSIVHFDYPTTNDLAAYFAEQLAERCGTEMPDEVEEYARELLMDRQMTYDRIDRIVYGIANQKEIIESPEELEKVMAEAILGKDRPAESTVSFGFQAKRGGGHV